MIKINKQEHYIFIFEIKVGLMCFKYNLSCYFSEQYAENVQATIMNADGIYLATYAALLLNLKLIRQGYYGNETKNIPLNEASKILS